MLTGNHLVWSISHDCCSQHSRGNGYGCSAESRKPKAGEKPVVWSTVLAGIPVGIGNVAGALLEQVSPMVLSVCMGFAAGAMMYVVSDELMRSPSMRLRQVPHNGAGSRDFHQYTCYFHFMTGL